MPDANFTKAVNTQQITVSSSALGIAAFTNFTADQLAAAISLTLYVEGADLRILYDGTTATGSLGILVSDGSTFEITGNSDINNISMIRDAGADVTVTGIISQEVYDGKA